MKETDMFVSSSRAVDANQYSASASFCPHGLAANCVQPSRVKVAPRRWCAHSFW